MSSAWLLPEHIADVLPSQARHIEELRRGLLDTARSCGYELVIPPLLEYIESLLSGVGEPLDLKTFKLVDQLTGRTMGLRADATPQVARIDAHLLNRSGVTRLCYCGPVLHTRPAVVHATREPLQFGAEVYGHQGLEADLEVLDLALDCAARIGLHDLTLDLGDARIIEAVWPSCVERTQGAHHAFQQALASKDPGALAALVSPWPDEQARAVAMGLLDLYGDLGVLERAREILKDVPVALTALDELAWLARGIERAHPSVRLSVDLGSSGGNAAYYTGLRFGVYAPKASSALIRGGRYDAIGAVFGRNRPAVGFGTDLKALAELTGVVPQSKAIRAPFGDSAALRQCVRELRQQGNIVLSVLPGHEDEAQEFDCDRELVDRNGQWQVVAR